MAPGDAMWRGLTRSLESSARFVVWVLCCAAAQGGCASSIGSVNEPARVSFTLGVTRKSEVVAALGLPALRKIQDDHEYWGYSDGPTTVSVTVPTNVSGNIATLTTYEWDEAVRAHHVYVFDSKGILVSSQARQ